MGLMYWSNGCLGRENRFYSIGGILCNGIGSGGQFVVVVVVVVVVESLLSLADQF